MAQSLGAFTATGSMTTTRFFHSATLLNDGRVLIAGGAVNAGGQLVGTNSAELYDPTTSTFTLTGSMIIGRILHTATLLPDGRVLIAGGINDPNAGTSAEIYDPATGTFTAAASMAGRHSLATLLNNGRVLMTGGSGQTPTSPAPNAEIYEPATGMFTAAGAYAESATGLLTTNLLADGRVLITGCKSDCGYDADLIQLYEPATGTFSLTGGRFDSRGPTGRTSTLLMNGMVLFAGGASEDSWYPYSDLYDPSTGTFARTGDMTRARDNHTATLLPDGEVLITGTRLDYESHTSDASAELYNPSTGLFTFIGNMTAPRTYHRATLLNDGRVLITGGAWLSVLTFPSTSRALSSAEIYTPAVVLHTPVLFSISGDGQGQGAILHAGTTRIVSSTDPAVAGEALEIYGTGLLDGSVIPPQVAVGGRLAEILFFGNAPGYLGLNQINVRLPNGVAPGPAVSVRMSYIGRSSNAVTIGVK